MKTYRNIFKEKTEEELILLYQQFLESERLYYIPDNDLGKIHDEYWEFFKTNMLSKLHIDLLRTISDLWYNNHTKMEN